MSNNYIPPSDGGAANNGSSSVHRREVRASHVTGALPALATTHIERNYPGAFDFDEMIQSLREQFEQDRQIASQSDATRCGICYLHFPVNELHYSEEGFYSCSNCSYILGSQKLPMLRKQQKM